ncbi:xanthine dehydrogenase accessory protein XdhC [Pseudoduganella eburnea]|uniref:Xanthine dehydrogenase accessory protein XdhC n=1 Tax=Massilia eburnea TaxID=1776165 RepID=A0A6L6QM98_9BURK|nr:xanthine dehydrogenase accessory protein XdhC [Massilia eburnea]MTW13290.1 xanthine dehydrogenase accessory protein XdhC [Massilia eburnea]
MADWLTPAGEPAVLVTVARAEGSVPREAGTHMLVTAGGQFDTVGGGHLEHRALDIARGMIGAGRSAAVHLERFPLGPSLGQCCGGVVWLLFEPVAGGLDEAMAQLRQRRREDSCRITAIDGAAECRLTDVRHKETHIHTDGNGRRWLIDPVRAPRAHLVLFGAGHVGAAIVRALGELPCTVTWVDERDAMFPGEVPDNVTIEATDTPEACVDEAPDGASYLVMTHSHALDQRLCEAILSRHNVGWFGLIGSKTKRAQFSNRMEAKGLSVESMVCPVGLPGIINKAPAVIAASVAAQLLLVWESQARD